MARPRKRRKICSLPHNKRFGPLGPKKDIQDSISMTVDEYETIRLIDLEGLNQEECAVQMGIGRSTVQGIYIEARKKLADLLVNGKILFIEGGDYKLCDRLGKGCGRGCHRHRRGQCFAEDKDERDQKIETDDKKTEDFMKIAIPVEEKSMASQVCASFGRAPYFLIYDGEKEEGTFIDNKAASSTGGAGITAAQTIVDYQANALLVPRLGENAAEVLEKADIKIYKAMEASVQENIDAFNSGQLALLDDIHAGFHQAGSK